MSYGKSPPLQHPPGVPPPGGFLVQEELVNRARKMLKDTVITVVFTVVYLVVRVTRYEPEGFGD